MAGGPIVLRRTQLAKALKVVPYLTGDEARRNGVGGQVSDGGGVRGKEYE